MSNRSSRGPGRSPRWRGIAATAVLAFGVVGVLQVLHGAGGEAHALHPLVHWLRDAALALPMAAAVVWAAPRIARLFASWAELGHGATRMAWALAAGGGMAAATIPGNAVHGHLFVADHALSASFLTHSLVDAAAGLGVGFVLMLAFAAALDAPWERLTRAVSARDRAGSASGRSWVPELSGGFGRRLAVSGLAVLFVASGLTVQGLPRIEEAAAQEPEATPCNAETANRSYHVSAINVEIPFNRWGDVNPHGQAFVLREDKAAVKNWDVPLASDPANDPAQAGNRRLRPRPLALRANEGDCVKIDFRNELNPDPGANSGLPANPRASMSVRGVPYDVQTSNGGAIGFNDDTTVGIGESATYFWSAPEEGMYFFHDQASPAGSEGDGGSLAHGLYGAFVVEPAGSIWTDPVSGAPLYEGTKNQSGELYIDAIIDPPSEPAFRESIQLAQDELPVVEGMGFNYATEQAGHRLNNRCPDCVGEETSLSSWAYGDPGLVKLASGRGPWAPDLDATSEQVEDCGLGTPGFDSKSCWTASVTHAYANDPTKIRFGMAGVKETHVFHLHAHKWLREDAKTEAGATPIDSQTFGPMETFTADLVGGAGGPHGTVGDSIFHCHLYPHFAEGFWGMLRVHDVVEDGTGTTPDGIKVRALQPLPDDGDVPPEPTPENPGFPRFVPGEFGWRAPQPPDGITDADGTPAERYVAGEDLDPAGADVALERNVMNRLSGGRSKPGAPFVDPCPEGAREVTYNVTALQVPITYNEAGWQDTQGRILVLDSDVDAVLAGEKNPEPLFVRVNAGDCINWNLTNRLPNWFGDDAFVKLSQTNMFGQHPHLVQFDVLASDGSSNGWNYAQGAFSKEQMDFHEAIQADASLCTASGCRVPDPSSYDPHMTSYGMTPGQTIHERWYAGSELRTVFTHDHHFAVLDQNRGQYGGLIIEPAGTDFRDPVSGEYFQPIDNAANAADGVACGDACEGTAEGTSMDVIGPGSGDDFREYGLAFQDFVSLTRPGGDPRNPDDVIGPPPAPETFPSEDPGTMAINYRNAPLELRRNAGGKPADPAHVFSSYLHGDPMTPLLQAYAGDPVRMRLIQGSHEEQHVFFLNGMRWRSDPADPKSPLTNSQPIGVSEAFNFEIPPMSCGSQQDCRGDFLYGSTAIDDLSTGMWGLMRVYGRTVPKLLPLPDNLKTGGGSEDLPPGRTGSPPPKATRPGNPCPSGAPVRSFDIVAFDTPITYNSAGDHDPYGLVYALAEDEQAIRDGQNPEPLTIRANEGECLDVTLTNKISQAWLDQHGSKGIADGDAPVPLERPEGTPAGLRVSLHPQLVRADVRGSDGTAVGFNDDQTVAPGESIQYRWHADKAVGATNLLEFGDVRGHRHHGLFAGLNIQPAGATHHDPYTGEEIASGGSADIRLPGSGDDFREFTTFFQDGLNLRDASGAIIEDAEEPHPPEPEAEPAHPEGIDAEDAGEKGFNYRSEPFRHRLGVEPIADPNPTGNAYANIYNSETHGDPATPILRAYEDDPVRIRVLQGSDKPRQHVYQLAGHSWRNYPGDEQSRTVASKGGFAPNVALNVHLNAVGGGSGADGVGDHLYSCAVGFFHRSDGLWGLMRVYAQPDAASALSPTALGDGPDNPRLGGHPIMPLNPERFAAPAPPAGPGGEGPAGEPAGEEPTGDTPAGEEPAGEDPTGEDPAGEDPAGEDPGTDPAEVTTACPPDRVPPHGFTDVDGNVHESAIGCLVWYEITQGMTETTYVPAGEVTRAQMASFIARTIEAADVALPAPSDQGFTDIAGNTHADRINQLAEVDVVRGIDEDTYGPSRLVSRAQMASFLIRAHEFVTGEELPSSADQFADDDGNVHEANINKAAEAGFTVGRGEGTYAPEEAVRRDQQASFLTRMLDRLVKAGHGSPPDADS